MQQIHRLCCNPKLQDSILMQNSIDTYRNTCGEYRILYNYDDTVLNITTIGRRNDQQAYKADKRKRR